MFAVFSAENTETLSAVYLPPQTGVVDSPSVHPAKPTFGTYFLILKKKNCLCNNNLAGAAHTLFVALFIKESFLKLHRAPPLPFSFSSVFVLHKRDSSVKNTFFLLYGSWCSSKNTALKLDPLTGSETTDTEEEEEE